MIRVRFTSRSQQLAEVSCSGHAGYAESGEDIVCASVSSAVQMTANLLTEIFQIPAEINVSDNRIDIILPEPVQKEASLILEGFELQLTLLQEEFPKRIKIEHTEV